MGKKGGTGRKDQGSSRAATKRKDTGPISGAAAKKAKKHLNRVIGDKGRKGKDTMTLWRMLLPRFL